MGSESDTAQNSILKPLHTRAEMRAFALARAREMTLSMTLAERVLWTAVEPLGFKAQFVIEVKGKPRILDFFHEEARLCIEVDGGYHKRRKGPDGRRDRALKLLGIETLRFTNARVMNHLDAVLEEIDRALRRTL